ncbi:MAG: class I SAM-dependent methyltransferase [Alphaproteobacteria bacterium]
MSMSADNQEPNPKSKKIDFAEVNEGKSDFDTIYNAPDPRGYCRTLSKLDYRIPAEAKPIFRSLIHALKADGHDPVRLVDIGCSYGINAALLKYGMNLGAFFDRYTEAGDRAAPASDMLRRESAFFDNRSDDGNVEIVGIDVAERALDFAGTVGLLDETISHNLEDTPLDEGDRDLIAGAHLVISTGCVGYVTEKTFRRVIDAAARGGPAPYVASFVLRMFPYTPIANALAGYGLVTEKLQDITFRQRRFENADERDHVLDQLRARGIASDLEEDGYYHAEFFLSRPAAEAKKRPLGYLI